MRQAVRQLTPWIIAVALFMETIDSTIINTAIPKIASSLQINPISLKFSLTSYLISLAVFIPISGWLADRFGAKKIFAIAMLIFTAGSILCGMSDHLYQLVPARIFQGFGGAMMTPVGRLILYRVFPKGKLINASTSATTPALIGPAIGPVLGGFITTYFSWRWIFYVNVPVGIIGFF